MDTKWRSVCPGLRQSQVNEFRRAGHTGYKGQGVLLDLKKIVLLSNVTKNETRSVIKHLLSLTYLELIVILIKVCLQLGTRRSLLAIWYVGVIAHLAN